MNASFSNHKYTFSPETSDVFGNLMASFDNFFQTVIYSVVFNTFYRDFDYNQSGANIYSNMFKYFTNRIYIMKYVRPEYQRT